MTGLQSLPEEVWFLVLCQVDAKKDLPNVALACTFFQRLCFDPSLWRALFVNRFGGLARTRAKEMIDWRAEYIWRANPCNRYRLFNEDTAVCIRGMKRDGILTDSRSFIRFLRDTPGLSPTVKSNVVTNPAAFGLDATLLSSFMEGLDMTGLDLLDALRMLFSECGTVFNQGGLDNALLAFAERFFHIHSTSEGLLFDSSDQIYTLAFYIILLNTDAHDSKVHKKMNCAKFIRNMYPLGLSFPRGMLEDFFHRVREKSITDSSGGDFVRRDPTLILFRGWVRVWQDDKEKRRWTILHPHGLVFYKQKCTAYHPACVERIEFLYNTRLLCHPERIGQYYIKTNQIIIESSEVSHCLKLPSGCITQWIQKINDTLSLLREESLITKEVLSS